MIKIIREFKIEIDHLIRDKKKKKVLFYKKNGTCYRVDFVVQAERKENKIK